VFHSPVVNRREFIRRAGLGMACLGSGSTAPLFGSGSAGAPGEVPTLPWVEGPMRWLSLILANDDPGNFDPDFWIDFVRTSHIDAVALNAGGIIATYPTAIPFHRRNPKLGDEDLLGYLIRGMRRFGVIITARVDHHATYPDAASAHPEWIARDPDGSMRRHPRHAELYLTCPMGDYNEFFMTAVMKEIVARYQVDGFNHNRWAPPAICYCEVCRSRFRAATGLALPDGENPRDERWVRYVEWRERRIWELWDLWDAAVRRIRPAAGILPAVPLHGNHLKLSELRRRAHTLHLDYQGRSGIDPPWMAAKKGKELRSILGDKPAALTFGVSGEETHRWKDSVQGGAEIQIWVSEAVAAGLRTKVTKFGGEIHDPRWIEPVRELYAWHERHERYLRNTASLARVGIVFSQQTARFHPAGERDEAGMGAYQALLEARLPTEMVHEDFLIPAEIDRFDVLVLPHVAALSNAQCDQLRDYVRRGGNLVATQETSLYDEIGNRRDNFALGDLFGVRSTGPFTGPIRNGYVRLEHHTRHPILDGFPSATTRLVHGAYITPVEPVREFPVKPLTLIPAYPDLPMEELYARQPHTDIAEVYLTEAAAGGGRVAYFPWSIDRTFWNVLRADLGQLFANTVRWAAGRPPVCRVDGRGLLDVSAWRQQSSLTVHLVNLTNPMTMRGPYREFFPVGPFEVRLELAPHDQPQAVHLLTAGRTLPLHREANTVVVEVPEVVLHEVVAIDLA
jgi:hypothetical protein